MKYYSLLFIILGLVLGFPQDIFASNLLLNPSFEEISGGIPNNWNKNVTTVTISLAQGVTGSMAASLTKINNTTGTIYLYQDVDVEPETYYRLSGLIQKNSASFSWAVLRISWRNTTTEVSKTDSQQVTLDSSEFKAVSIDAVQVPSLSTKARIELVGNIITPNPASPILFEDIEFLQIPPPEQPTIALPTATNTPTMTPTLKVNISPSPQKIPSIKPIISYSPTPSLSLGKEFVSISTESSVLSATISAEINQPTLTPIIRPLGSEKKAVKAVFSYPGLALILGGLFTISCAILTLRIWNKKGYE